MSYLQATTNIVHLPAAQRQDQPSHAQLQQLGHQQPALVQQGAVAFQANMVDSSSSLLICFPDIVGRTHRFGSRW